MRTPPFHVQLCRQARELATQERGKPKQVSLRRATSAAYYALFHFLIDQATRQIIGSRAADANQRHWLARAFKHNEMAEVSKSFGSGNLPRRAMFHTQPIQVPKSLRSIASAFLELQEARHEADYDLLRPFVVMRS